MIDSSDMAGMYAPPAVQDPSTAATCGMPLLESIAWFLNILPKWSLSGNTSSCMGRNAPPESTR